jgi:hypothetical protein
MTLLEYAKTAFNGGEFTKSAVVEMFARASAWLAQMSFITIQGNAYAYNREGALPGVAFRGVNESFTASTGVINPHVEALRISGGDLTFDNFLIRTMGEGRRGLEENMKVKALAAEISRVLVKGDSTAEPREFDGLQARVTGDQLIAAGTTDNGDALSLVKLDEAIDAVPGANAIWLNKALRRRFSAALRTTTLAGNIEQTRDDFGRPIMTYAGIPLVVPYPDNDGVEPLAFDEAGDVKGTPAGSSSTSLYVLNIGEGRVAGIQSQPMSVRDLGEMETEPKVLTRVEWDIGLVVEHGRAVSRVGGISDAAIVA